MVATMNENLETELIQLVKELERINNLQLGLDDLESAYEAALDDICGKYGITSAQQKEWLLRNAIHEARSGQ